MELGRKGTVKATDLYKAAYQVIGNKRYADAVVLLVKEIIGSVRALGISLDKVTLRDWWMLQSRGSPRSEDKGNLNIRLVSTEEVKVVLFNGTSWNRYTTPVRVPKLYREVFEDVARLGLSRKIGYLARIVALDMAYDRVYAEL